MLIKGDTSWCRRDVTNKRPGGSRPWEGDRLELVKVEYSCTTIFGRGICWQTRNMHDCMYYKIVCGYIFFTHYPAPGNNVFSCCLSLALPCQEDHLQSAFLVKLKTESNLVTLHPGVIFSSPRNFSDGIFASRSDHYQIW